MKHFLPLAGSSAWFVRCVNCHPGLFLWADGGLCDRCRHQASQCVTTTPQGRPARALGPYSGLLASRITDLKYAEATHWARPLGRALARLHPDGWRDHLLVPVPLHPQRLIERGYNQSALLARWMGSRSRALTGVAARERRTAPQARLAKAERIDNVAGAFATRRGPQPSECGRPVVLVDDVMTTGSTADACANALEQAGFQVADIVVCALSNISQ